MIIRKINTEDVEQTRVFCYRNMVISPYFNTFYEGLKNVKILEFGDYIWNHHEKCIQISTHMPGIGLEIC